MTTPSPQASPLTSLPRLEDLRMTGDGTYEPDAVREAFDSFRRHALQLQAQLRVLQAAGQTANVDPTGHAVRMDALHLIRAASEFADVLERDAQEASAAQLARTEEEVRRRQRELQGDSAEIERRQAEVDRQVTELLTSAKAEAAEVRKNGEQHAAAALREAEARGTRFLEQSRHQATELTNAARAEVEQTLDWARTQAAAIVHRAQEGAEQLLSAAGLGAEDMARVVQAILGPPDEPAAPEEPQRVYSGVFPVAAPPPEREPEPEREAEPEPEPEPTGEEPPGPFAGPEGTRPDE